MRKQLYDNNWKQEKESYASEKERERSKSYLLKTTQEFKSETNWRSHLATCVGMKLQPCSLTRWNHFQAEKVRALYECEKRFN